MIYKFLTFLLIVLFLPIFFILFILVYTTSKGPVIFYANCIGKNGSNFRMPKFRTFLEGTPIVASDSLDNPNFFFTPVGSFLRRTSMDELPQLFSVLKGDMSLIGPRPALFNQYDLIALRKKKGVDKSLPGITGWAQVNGRDKLSISDKVAFDLEYVNHQSFWFDMKILWMTFYKVIKSDGVRH